MLFLKVMLWHQPSCINGWTGKENVGHIHNEVESAMKKNKLMSSVGKWVELGATVLNEIISGSES